MYYTALFRTHIYLTILLRVRPKGTLCLSKYYKAEPPRAEVSKSLAGDDLMDYANA